jgi:hypothetical protein
MRLVIAVLALALAASAAAKGPDRASVCGATHCVTVQGDIHVWSLLEWLGSSPFMVRDAPKPAPYYAIEIRDWGELLYLPNRNVIRVWQGPHAYGNFAPNSSSAPYWRSLPPSARTLYAKLVRGLAPRAAPARWPAVSY